MTLTLRKRTKDLVPPAEPVPGDPTTPPAAPVKRGGAAEDTYPRNAELGADLERLERHQRAVEDRRRTEELARLRKVQQFD